MGSLASVISAEFLALVSETKMSLKDVMKCSPLFPEGNTLMQGFPKAVLQCSVAWGGEMFLVARFAICPKKLG